MGERAKPPKSEASPAPPPPKIYVSSFPHDVPCPPLFCRLFSSHSPFLAQSSANTEITRET